MKTTFRCFAALSLISSASIIPAGADAQWATSYEQHYLPGTFNWQFRKYYPAADRLFNAFDYGHAILYEQLWARPSAPVSVLEEKEYDFITRKLLTNPPALPLEEAAIEPAYAKLVPEAKLMFEWAHLLHRQIYDVWGDERLSVEQKDAKVAELIRYYKTRKDLAFSSQPKSMDLMEGQPYSLAFRKAYPKFNGLIWAYHWLQVGLYEPLIAGKTKEERQTGVLAAVTRFRQMIEQPPSNMPRVMPMTPAVAPLFSARYPEAAIIFDNLHSMHDVISDILANPSVPRNRKRAAIVEAAKRYRDDTSYVTTRAEWLAMAAGMGVENMGGPVRGLLTPLPAATVEPGAVMSHRSHGAAPGTPKQDTAAAMDHAAMGHEPAPAPKPPMNGMHAHHLKMQELQALMLADPVIRARVQANPEMRRKLEAMGDSIAPKSAVKPAVTRKKTTAKKTTAKKSSAASRPAAAAKPKPKPATKPKADPHAGMDHRKMNNTPKK